VAVVTPADRDLLVSAEALAGVLAGDLPPVVLDVRWKLGGPPGHLAYEAGHVPGSVYADLDRDLAAPPGARGRHPLPDPADFESAMRALGVSDGRAVVVYDDGGQVAARAWWDLTYFGHGDVRLLDGGFDAWTGAGLPVETGPGPSPAPGDFTARAGGLPVVDMDGAAEIAGTGLLLDSRAGERYRGEVEPVDPVAGHVPGAVNAPAAALTLVDGRFRSPGELAETYAGLGVTSERPVAAYCGSGVVAAHQVLALRLAGFDAALWPGSWSEWVADESRPVAIGEA
jgi:thiosulfate/3-mercaptopyruvate sulfurtransferase